MDLDNGRVEMVSDDQQGANKEMVLLNNFLSARSPKADMRALKEYLKTVSLDGQTVFLEFIRKSFLTGDLNNDALIIKKLRRFHQDAMDDIIKPLGLRFN